MVCFSAVRFFFIVLDCVGVLNSPGLYWCVRTSAFWFCVCVRVFWTTGQVVCFCILNCLLCVCVEQNESRNTEMLAAACAVGVGCCFAAPIGGQNRSCWFRITFLKVSPKRNQTTLCHWFSNQTYFFKIRSTFLIFSFQNYLIVSCDTSFQIVSLKKILHLKFASVDLYLLISFNHTNANNKHVYQIIFMIM